MQKTNSPTEIIPGIYNYCDRWCERCTMTAHCQLYREEQEAIAADPDIQSMDNQAFWDHLSDNMTKALKMLSDHLAEQGIDINDLPAVELEPFEEEQARFDEMPYIAAAQSYNRTAHQWLKTQHETIQQRQISHLEMELPNAETETAALGEALEVIQWYLFQIEVKLRRAQSSVEFDEEEGLEDSEEYPADWKVSARIALLGIERSLAAWAVLYQYLPEFRDEMLPFMGCLQKAKRLVSKRFPQAVGWQRPYFDQPAN